MKAVRIDVYGNLTEVDLPTDEGDGFLRAVRDLVEAAAVERLALAAGWEIWVDEDGIASERPTNRTAAALVHRQGFVVRGTAVVTRIDVNTGRGPAGI